MGECWQGTTLHMSFDVKRDLRKKARMVSGSHIIDMMETPVYSYTFKNISVKLLHVISHKTYMTQLCDCMRNDFPNAYKNEKLFVKRSGTEFVEHEGKVIIICKS